METLKQKITASGKKPPKFRKKGHKYTKDEIEYTSVTTFVHSFFTPFDSKGISKFVALNRRKKGEKVTATQVRKEWKAMADDGSTVHKQIENYVLKGEKPTHPKAMQGAICLEQTRWMDKEKYILNPELIIWSDKLKLCGTSDLVIENGSNKLSIVDWKTNREIRKTARDKGNCEPVKDIDNCNYMQYALQLSTYAYIMETEFNFKIDTLHLMHLQDGQFVNYVVPYLKDTVEAMIKWKLQNK